MGAEVGTAGGAAVVPMAEEMAATAVSAGAADQVGPAPSAAPAEARATLAAAVAPAPMDMSRMAIQVTGACSAAMAITRTAAAVLRWVGPSSTTPATSW